MIQSTKKGEKRLFIFYGILNFLITNIILQITLLLIPTIFATLLSQLINVIIGFSLYGKKVFKLNSLNNFIFFKYLFLAFILWFLNFTMIQFLFSCGVNKNLAALLIMPLFVVSSYLSQKNYVFK